MLRTITILAGLAIATSLAAQTPDPEAEQAQIEADVRERIDLEEIVCRNLRPPTGTRIQRRRTERVCQTRREWEHRTEEAQAARRAMDNGTCGGRCSLPGS